jgi:hypothetical protein
MCIVVAIVSTLLVIFQLSMGVARTYVTNAAVNTTTLYAGEVGAIADYAIAVQVPMIYNALIRSDENWTYLTLVDGPVATVGDAHSADALLKHFGEKANVEIEDDTVKVILVK